jgi:DnaJ-class molecular chaperone
MPTPTGAVDLKIPANARRGQKLRLKGRGLPATQKGDLYAELHIVNPPTLSDDARARKVARLMRDLGLNVAGVALVLDLIEERDALAREIG